MKKIVYILTILLILSCKEKTTEVRFYPTYPISQQDSLENLSLDHSKMTFKEITDWISENQYNGIKSIIEFKDDQIAKKIIPFVRGSGLYKKRNILRLTSDSILIDDGYIP